LNEDAYMTRLSLLFAATLAFATPASADEISDTIQSALDAYNEGDTTYALEELNFAIQQINALKKDSLAGFLPEALDGWTREIDDQMAAGMMAFGGGVGASAEYRNGTNDFTITYMADNPMVASMAGMLANPALTGGKMIRVGRQKFVSQDGQMMALIGNRVLVQVDGDDADAITAHLETVDFKAMAGFGL
jgi:hypothetical protein